MKFTFTLDEDDFLTSLLFAASKSETIARRRQRTRFLIPLIYLVFGIYNLNSNKLLAVVFIIIAIVWFLFYPLREKNRYIRHYKKIIKEGYSERIGKICSVELKNDFIILIEGTNESKILTTDIDSFTEIASGTLIKLKTGTTVLLPKAKINNYVALRTVLKGLAQQITVSYNEEMNWSWK